MEAKRLDKSPVTLRDLVDEVFEDTASMGVTADNQVSPELTIFADRTQLYRALFNLVRNAIEAIVDNAAAMETGADGTVSISTVYNDNSVSILIADTGPGLPDHAKAELFEPFKGSQKPGGSGLGVAIAAEIVRAHGGKIALQKSDETGAVFQINLPHRTSAL